MTPQVLPSEIVSFIDRQFPGVEGPRQGSISSAALGNLTALLSLVDKLPNHLITLSGDAYVDFIHCVESIRSIVTVWGSRGSTEPHENSRAANDVSRLRSCLSNLADQGVPAATAGLPFITDAQLRESIRADMAFADQAFTGGEWKATTVLAGSVAEALLLWAIGAKKTRSEVEAAARSAAIPNPAADPDNWGLDAYIKVARALTLIKENTAQQATLAKNFRNLIHPGRSARLQEVCDRGSAYSALAAVEFIVRDLS